ncbi:hypothetical protein PHMEG_0005358 [Phytophthora megakarya]|uniref:Uncharacterized protein n=1 Tax=Phytophthora megakarya TaxID=4795 RepID=A0A225WRK1_9STRA|nr:hypothetical protein PHMEG_0005358 [Phytophthora megakarya]
MNAQRFVESVQIYWRKFSFFPHAAVLRGLFGWDFDTRGYISPPPTPADATDFAVLVGAVDLLYNIARQLYQPVVHQTLEAAETFLRELRVTDLPVSASAVNGIETWIDSQLGLFRVYVADGNWALAATIQSHFSASNESFVRVHQAILRQEVFSAVKAVKAGSVRNTRSNRVNVQDKQVTIPVDVREVFQKQDHKEICLRFLFAQGCRGKNGNHIIKHIYHFKPATLPEIV